MAENSNAISPYLRNVDEIKERKAMGREEPAPKGNQTNK